MHGLPAPFPDYPVLGDAHHVRHQDCPRCHRCTVYVRLMLAATTRTLTHRIADIRLDVPVRNIFAVWHYRCAHCNATGTTGIAATLHK